MPSFLKLPKVGLEEIKKKKVAFAKELAAELLGTMLMVMIGCGSTMSGDKDDGEGQISGYQMSGCHRKGDLENNRRRRKSQQETRTRRRPRRPGG